MTNPVLLITRPQAASARFVAELSKAALNRVDVICAPLIEIVGLGVSPDTRNYGGVIFSSAQAVAFAPDGGGCPAFCVGTQTAEQAARRGWQVQTVASDADTLVKSLISKELAIPLLHMAGIHRRGEIAKRLTHSGLHVDAIALYDQVLRPLSAEAKTVLSGETSVIVPLFSPRTATQFANEAGNAAAVRVLTISRAVSDALGRNRFGQVVIAPAPNGLEMRRGVEKMLACVRLP